MEPKEIAAQKAAEAGNEMVLDEVKTLMNGFFETKMPDLIKSQIEEQMKTLAENTAAKASVATPVDSLDELGSMETWEKCSKFYNDYYKGDTSFWTTKGLSEGVDSEGGFLVPDPVAAEISRIAENFGLIRALSRRVTMSSDSLNIPTVETSVTTSWPGEKNAGTESNPVFGNRKLKAQTQVGISTITNELLRDANRSVVGIINNLFAEAFAGEEDEQGLNGVSAPFTGVMNDTDVNANVMATGSTAFSSATLQDYLDMTGGLKDGVVRKGVYVMHRTVWLLVLGLQEGSQTVYAIQNSTQPVIQRGERDSGIKPVGFLHGKPVYVSDKMPATSASAVSTKFAIFGNFDMLAFGDRQRMTMALSESAVVGSTSMFETNQKAIRFTESVAIQILQPTAFVTLSTSAS